MLPTACFSIGKSRSSTAATFTEESCESERLTLFGGAVCAASAAGAGFGVPPGRKIQNAIKITAVSTNPAIAALAPVISMRGAIVKPDPARSELPRQPRRTLSAACRHCYKNRAYCHLGARLMTVYQGRTAGLLRPLQPIP